MKLNKIIATSLMVLSLVSIFPTCSAFADTQVEIQHEQDKAFIETCTYAKDEIGIPDTYEKDGKYYSYYNGLIQRNKMTGKNYAKADGSLAHNEWVYLTYTKSDHSGSKTTSAWRYYGDDFQSLKDIQIINGKKYVFADNGNLGIGWFMADTEDGKGWYYSQSDGSIKEGWLKYNGDWYYINSNGRMLKNTTVDGYRLNRQGKWVQ